MHGRRQFIAIHSSLGMEPPRTVDRVVLGSNDKVALVAFEPPLGSRVDVQNNDARIALVASSDLVGCHAIDARRVRAFVASHALKPHVRLDQSPSLSLRLALEATQHTDGHLVQRWVVVAVRTERVGLGSRAERDLHQLESIKRAGSFKGLSRTQAGQSSSIIH